MNEFGDTNFESLKDYNPLESFEGSEFNFRNPENSGRRKEFLTQYNNHFSQLLKLLSRPDSEITHENRLMIQDLVDRLRNHAESLRTLGDFTDSYLDSIEERLKN